MNADLEEAIYEFLIETLSNRDQKELSNGRDILRHLENNPDAESDLKEYAWELVIKQLRFYKIIERIKERLEEQEEDSEEEQ